MASPSDDLNLRHLRELNEKVTLLITMVARQQDDVNKLKQDVIRFGSDHRRAIKIMLDLVLTEPETKTAVQSFKYNKQ